MDRVDQTVDRLALHDVAVSTGAERTLREQALIVHREDENAQVRDAFTQRADEIQAVTALEREIDNRQVGIRGLGETDCFFDRFSFTANRDGCVGGNHLTDADTDERMIVNDEYACRQWLPPFEHLRLTQCACDDGSTMDPGLN